MKEVFLIGATGFIFLSLYNHRTKNHYRESNSNKLLIFVFVCGIFPYVSSIIIQEILLGCDVVAKFFSNYEKLLFGAGMLLSSICAVFWSFLFSCSSVRKIWSGFKEMIIVEDDGIALDDGLIDYDFSKFIKDNDVVILTLKNSKVYVGWVLFIDVSESISPEQRSMKILPLKSGYRNQNGSVDYDTDYVSAIDPEDKDEKILSVMQSKIPPLVVLQREVVSYTKYDSELDRHFGHSEYGNLDGGEF